MNLFMILSTVTSVSGDAIEATPGLVDTLNGWFGYISNIAVGFGAFFIVLLTQSIRKLLTGSSLGSSVVAMTMTKLKEVLAKDSPERAELLETLYQVPEFQKVMAKVSEDIEIQALNLEKMIMDVETKLKSGILSQEEMTKYKELLAKIEAELAKLKELGE